MNVGIGYQNEQNAWSAGKKVAEAALEQGQISRPDLVVAFCSGQLAAEEFFRGLQAVVGQETPIIGGSAIGLITNEVLAYTGYPAGAVIIQTDAIRFRIAAAGGLDHDERQAGRAVAEKLACTPEDKLLLMFYDSIKTPATSMTPPVMNASPLLIGGIEETFGRPLPIIGAGVLGDYAFQPTQQFCGTYVGSQSVAGALLSGDFELYYRIMHGCVPMDGIYHRITSMEGAFIYELDGKPIVDRIDTVYGSADWQTQLPVKRLSIGVNVGEKYGDFQEDQYINRLIAGALPDRQGIILFEPDLENGLEIQFMLRDEEQILASAKNNTVGLFEQILAAGHTPAFGLYIDCAGRNASVSEMLTEEATEVMTIFNQYQTPLFGFYSGVEVAPFLGKSRGLDWTGVLVVFTKE